MTNWTRTEDEQLDGEDLSPPGRRRTVLEQIEAALRAEKLRVVDGGSDAPGSDPYNRVVARGDAWGTRRR